MAIRRPLKVLDAVNLDTLFVQQPHAGGFVDLNHVDADAGDVFLVKRPLEQGPYELGFSRSDGGCKARIIGGLGEEGSKLETSGNIPDDGIL